MILNINDTLLFVYYNKKLFSVINYIIYRFLCFFNILINFNYNYKSIISTYFFIHRVLLSPRFWCQNDVFNTYNTIFKMMTNNVSLLSGKLMLKLVVTEVDIFSFSFFFYLWNYKDFLSRAVCITVKVLK